MTRLNLDLTTRQINILFKALESLEKNNSGLSDDIIKLTRYLDSVVFVEKWSVENK
jgi:lysyl-tRNA synthetase class II